ncbi:ATP-independent RNA helicase dbpA [Vibrio nigripulchritudo SFn27]|uniref:DEAD-box ATP-dependent RNA helicase RhpA n=1 Tax=Vibrio nigripulchritudo TaxID=28173 RepID=U4KBF9_9VIBR|nr:ATP-dependent RNA helicase DbpA [Vibrio nigripulchritudo]CCN85285.1 ATP-independent RNA helicase dbpA [Vibrio nigripulchritudo BLFn1]CCN87565.1 ATP-independent RNA helicase dbpA [Vibrio nigripulchritudo SFn27]CCN92446.1 ATP-independent RNA helicase dbpA [Vibrio nigripulchritudo ENn2]CCO39310.1 ATP-independent RNA helicase dbpA [Vibrio nigripulchritudo SFn135]CCO53462.1 ATP-independent RNA helicase dbpA [Vibrio nigripulchritudo Wn13]
MSNTSFKSLGLKPELLTNLDSLGYEEMTPIQAQSLPFVLKGQDVIGQGKTGSGKTATFGLGLLQNLNVKKFRVQSLVLCPTRELADQVAKEIRKLARAIHNIKVLTLCGGMPMGPQIGSLEHGAHILVGTPGRILDHLDKGRISLEHLNTLVLDEADRMLDMGFQDALDAIIEQAPTDRQTLLFSATFPDSIEAISKRILRKPQRITVESTHDTVSIRQHFYDVAGFEERLEATRRILMQDKPESTVIFCNTKRDVDEVADELRYHDFSVIALHGDMEQRQRDQALVQFANKSVSILVATDVAARGLDVDNLDAVINFHLARDPEVHVHRIGRTGRAGAKGCAHSFISEKESYKVAQIEEYFDFDIRTKDLPSEDVLNQRAYYAKMVTLQIDGGKKQKVRPGDILGALTGDDGIPGSQVGKINVFPMSAYVAVHTESAKKAFKKLEKGKLKGKQFRVRYVKN